MEFELSHCYDCTHTLSPRPPSPRFPPPHHVSMCLCVFLCRLNGIRHFFFYKTTEGIEEKKTMQTETESDSPQVLGLVQEWSRLTAMKQRLLRRSGLLFCSAAAGLQQLAATQRSHATTSRSVTDASASWVSTATHLNE